MNNCDKYQILLAFLNTFCLDEHTLKNKNVVGVIFEIHG